jgi:hypothetical protein
LDQKTDTHNLQDFGSHEIRTAVTRDPDCATAVRELYRALDAASAEFVILFVSRKFDLGYLGECVTETFGSTEVVGCTTAGEISPSGYETGTITGISFARTHFRMRSYVIPELSRITISQSVEHARNFVSDFNQNQNRQSLAFLFADGVSGQEDHLIAALDAALFPVPVFGGSAGDGLSFKATFILKDGRFQSDAALLVFVETDCEIAELCFDHILPTETRMVVTEADLNNRILIEINAEPAAEEYARIVGVDLEDLSPLVFAANPLLVQAGGRYHVRSIQKVRDDGSLRLFSAIEKGLVLTLGRGQDIAGNLNERLSALTNSGSPPLAILGFDCILRRLEIEQTGKIQQVSKILRNHGVVGFNTYGEQHSGMHVNQTFVGVAFFQSNRETSLHDPSA